jgi:polysaccharide biosynthesis/export protein
MSRSPRTDLRLASLSAILVALAGCAGTVPIEGPTAGQIVDQADPTQPAAGQTSNYVLVNVDAAVAARVGRREPTSFAATFGDHRPGGEQVIGIGDAVSVTIWEAGPGGLFSAPLLSDKIAAGSNAATIPDQLVGQDGAITVPYAGRVPVTGRTTRAVQAVIEKALQGKAIQPQVLVNIDKPVSTTATVNGEVVHGARIPLSLNGDRLLDVIAEAGGIQAPVHESFVELTRGGRTTRVSLTRVVNDPKQNIYIHAGDDITVIHDPQTYMVLGAANRSAQIPFTSDGATLAEALANGGGLNDNLADPTGVFVFRYEPIAVIRQLKPDWVPPDGATATYPVIYRIDLTAAQSLLLAQKFSILNRDIVYVSNAAAVQYEKLATLFNTALGAFNNAGQGVFYVKSVGVIK